MKDAILKSWKSTLVGVLAIGYYAYKSLIMKEPINMNELVSVLFAIGFLVTKDASASHTK